MGLYARFIFPRVCDWLLGQPAVEQHRRDLLAGVDGTVLEIGFGTGLNLPCYPAHVRKITMVDPNIGMHRLAKRRIERSGIEIDQRQLGGEALPFADGAFDCVVSTFTLCSIPEVNRAMSEVYRVLKPSGRFLFLEHGLSPEPAVQKWQRRLDWFEQCVADGCHLDRDIRALVAGQPFAAVDVANSYLERMPKTHGYLYRGTAVK